jgi:serine protease inhibitor
MRFLFASFAILFLAGCRSEAPPVANPPQRPTLNDNSRKTIAAANEFAVDLYRQIALERGGNLVFSPLVTTISLSMIHAGARGQTADEIATALRWTDNDDDRQAAIADLLGHARAVSGQPQLELHFASRMWGQRGDKFLPGYLTALQQTYHVEPGTLNYSRPGAASRQINDWISEQTNGKISRLVDPSVFNPNTKLVLATAAYFKAKWQEPFIKRYTRDRAFHRTAEDQTQVPFMVHGHDLPFKYASLDGLRLLELPYQNEEVSMLLVLPDEVEGLPALESELAGQTVTDWIKQMKVETPHLVIPKFRFETQLEMRDPLAAVGVERVFSQQADLSAVDGTKDLFVQAALHGAFIDVNEEFTEAAGAMVAVTDKAIMEKEQPTFIADHPFLFLIRDNVSGIILFMGRVTDPSK